MPLREFEEPIEEPMEEPLEEPVELTDDEEIANAVQAAITGAATRDEKIAAAIAALEGLRTTPGLGGLGGEGLGLEDMEPEEEYLM